MQEGVLVVLAVIPEMKKEREEAEWAEYVVVRNDRTAIERCRVDARSFP